MPEEGLKQRYAYIVTFWGHIWPPYGRVWISRDVDWPIDSKEEGMSNGSAVVTNMTMEFGSDLRWVDLV